MVKILKLFALVITIFISSYAKSYSEIVKKVTIEGNQRISKATIIIYGDIKIGSDYETKDINLLIKKLYETKFFSNISVELDSNILNIQVEENPIVNQIIFNGEKVKKFKETLAKILTLREKTSFIKSYVKSDINIIKEFYRNLGFYFIKIEAEIEKLDRNRVNLVYFIEKGDRAKISKIYFLGDKKIRDKRLRDVITSQESKFWKFISKNVYLNKSRIDLDKRLLKNYYKNKGYYEVQISSSSVEYAEGEGFVLTYSINAGQRYRFKKISLNVSEALDQSAFLPLEKEFDKVAGKYYSQKKLTSLLEKIDKLSEQKELQFINHRALETLDADTVEVKIEIYEGEKFIIERIDIAGNNVTNDSVIRSEMIVDEGDPYSALLVNKSVNKLKARGIFSKVEQKIVEGSSPDLKVLEISIEEKATGEIVAGAGVGTDGTAFMGAVTENNWLGRGITLDTRIDITQETISGSIAVTNPNFNYSGNSVRASADVSSSDLKKTSGYESSKTGLSLGTGFEQYEGIFLSPGFSATYEDIEVESTASSNIQKMDGTFYNMDFDYGITVDRRNQVFQPTSGFRANFSQTLPIIIDSSSIRNKFDISAYHNVSDDIVGSIKFLASSIHGLDNEDVRLTNRLFVPQNRLRGFNTRKIGPKDGEDYIGGNYVSTLNLEAALPNLLPESTRTDITLFTDFGNIWSVDYDSSLDDTNEIRTSIGIAANVWTPVGPLSFTLAEDLNKSINDETQTFNFRIGTSF
tara:strand:- start:18082 stop:20328 length:2247 start_codon:yes stop_codon:yes gene_type:complete